VFADLRGGSLLCLASLVAFAPLHGRRSFLFDAVKRNPEKPLRLIRSSAHNRAIQKIALAGQRQTDGNAQRPLAAVAVAAAQFNTSSSFCLPSPPLSVGS